MADEDAKILADALKLPLAERAEHKNWKVRSALFESLRESFAKAFSEDDPILAESGAWWYGKRRMAVACAALLCVQRRRFAGVAVHCSGMVEASRSKGHRPARVTAAVRPLATCGRAPCACMLCLSGLRG